MFSKCSPTSTVSYRRPKKSLDILYDKRDNISAATLASLEDVPVFRELTDKDNVSLRAKSPKLFTLAALYDANRELLKGREDANIIENAHMLTDYWKAVAEHMPDWNVVLTRHKEAGELRGEKIASHSTVLRALGGLGLDLMKDSNWKNRLEALEQIDWSKKNPDWEDVCIIANSVVSNRQARVATKSYIQGRLGMELTESEQRSFRGSSQKVA